MNTRDKLILMGSALLLSACVAPSQNALSNASAACSYGDRGACAQVPALNAQVQQENMNNQVGAAAAAAVGGAVVGGALAAPYGYNRGYYYGRPYGYRGYYRGW
jgi:uncharacterized Zn-binding protein involved in type VI secretion